MSEDKKWYMELPYQEVKSFIRANIQCMTREFVAVGYYLKYIRDHEQYKEDGYSSIWEFAEDMYGIQRTTCSRWMAINDRFSEGGNSPTLAEQYREFGKSQLQEMLYLEDRQLDEVTPDMTVKDIREIRAPKSVHVEECATSHEDNIPGQSVEDFPEIMPENQEEDAGNTSTEILGSMDDSAVIDVECTEIQEEHCECATSDLDVLREMLEKEKHDLDEYIKIDKVEPLPWRMMQKKKILVGALASMLCDLEDSQCQEESVQPELPRLKNNDQRKKFIESYRTWPIWFNVPNASEVYYRFDLPDGTSLVICEYRQWLSWKEDYTDENPDSVFTREYLLTPGYHYLNDCRSNTSALVEHLKNVQKGEENDRRKEP
jgi:hypothetical protein